MSDVLLFVGLAAFLYAGIRWAFRPQERPPPPVDIKEAWRRRQARSQDRRAR
jgi:hypothetical protein